MIITVKTVKSQFIIETTSQHIEHNIKVCEALTNDYNIKKDPFNNEQDFFFHNLLYSICWFLFGNIITLLKINFNTKKLIFLFSVV